MENLPWADNKSLRDKTSLRNRRARPWKPLPLPWLQSRDTLLSNVPFPLVPSRCMTLIKLHLKPPPFPHRLVIESTKLVVPEAELGEQNSPEHFYADASLKRKFGWVYNKDLIAFLFRQPPGVPQIARLNVSYVLTILGDSLLLQWVPRHFRNYALGEKCLVCYGNLHNNLNTIGPPLTFLGAVFILCNAPLPVRAYVLQHLPINRPTCLRKLIPFLKPNNT